MNAYYDTMETPFGPFSIAVDETGAVVGTTFRAPPPEWEKNPSRARAARREMEEFWSGKRRDFALPLAPRGTGFQQSVWKALVTIPYGETRSYKWLAATIGNPKGCRAVGSANGANPICVIIPCHRVIAADGTLGGFGFGLPLKRQLLDFERKIKTG